VLNLRIQVSTRTERLGRGVQTALLLIVGHHEPVIVESEVQMSAFSGEIIPAGILSGNGLAANNGVAVVG